MSKNKKHISKKDFQRYLGNKMTDAERNLFERELQKHPFEAEALEGLQQFSPGDIQNDINKLSENILNKTKRKNTRFWATAATILLLVSVGVIWFQIKDKSPTPEMAQTKSIQEQSEKLIPESLSEEIQKEIQPIEQKEIARPTTNEIAELQEPVTKSTSDRSMDANANDRMMQKAGVISEQDRIQPLQQEESVVNEFIVSEQENDTQIQIRGITAISKPEAIKTPQLVQAAKMFRVSDLNQNIIKGQVISLGDSMPLPGVSIVQKGTSNATISDLNGEFTLQLENRDKNTIVASFVGMENTEFIPNVDSIIMVGMEPSQVAMEEVVVTGYGSQNKSALSKSSSTFEVHEVQPKIGMDKFREFIKENAVLPEDYTLSRVVVRSQIKINPQGKIISIENKNDAENEWFEKAKELIMNGSDWNPKTINGTPIESEITIRIVFKK